jgi:O-antigen/teichoic acid export membrane protein
MKKSITKSYIYNLSYQFVLIISPLIVAPYIARILGAESIGIYSYTQSIVTNFKLFASIGISLYAQVEIAYVQNDIDKRSKLFWEIISLRILSTVLLLVPYIIYATNISEYKLLYMIQTIDIIAVLFDVTWFFQGLEEFKKVAFINIIVKITEVVFILIFVKSPDDLWIYILCYSLALIVSNLLLWIFLKKFLKSIKISILELKKHIYPVIYLFFPQMATQIYSVLDKTLLGIIINLKVENGYYEQSQRIIRSVLLIITALGTVMTSRIAKEFAADNMKKINDYIYKSFQFILFLSFPAACGIFSIADSFVPFFYGNGYDKVIIILRILSPVIIFIGLSNVTGMQYLIPLKKYKEFTISVLTGAIINVTLNLILITHYKSIGVSIAIIIAELFVVIIQFFFIKSEINIFMIWKMCSNYVISSIIMMVVIMFYRYINKPSIITMGFQIIIGTIIYLTCLVLVRDEGFLSVIKRLKMKGQNHNDNY